MASHAECGVGYLRNLWVQMGLGTLSVVAALVSAVAPAAAASKGISESARVAMDRANIAMHHFVQHYWQADNNLFYNSYPYPQSGNNYWWEANAVDALAEGVQLHLTTDCAKYIHLIYQRIAADGSAVTAYFDDEDWMGLGMLHAYRATGNKQYLHVAEVLFADIYGHGWQKKGGIIWNRIGSTYRNTPANAPAALLGAGLYAVTHNRRDLAEAEQIYAWEWSHLVAKNGMVWDGMQVNNQLNKAQYTYNYGTVIGASLKLWQDTHRSVYLENAQLVAKRSIAVFTDAPSLLLTPTGQGDGGLFKGIYVRYLSWMVRDFPKQTIYRRVLEANAQNVWLHDRTPEGSFASNWANPKKPPQGDIIQLSTELSGIFLMNQIAGLQKGTIGK